MGFEEEEQGEINMRYFYIHQHHAILTHARFARPPPQAEDQLKNKQKREEDRLGRLEGTVKEKLTREAVRERQKVVKHIVRTVSASALTVR